MSDELDVLISRHLDGTASRDEMRDLDERVQRDPAARRALLLAAAQDAQLRELLVPGDALGGRRASRWRRWAVGAVAAVMLAAGGLALLAARYPAPRVSGAYSVVGGGEVGRGSVITAEAPSATLALGGYCRVGLEPGSRLRIEGGKRAEQVFLERGAVTCEADRGVGAFAVRTPVGTASVKGTRFSVRMIEEKGERKMFGKRMFVRVFAGAVLVSGAWGATLLHGGEGVALPPPEAALVKIVSTLDLPGDQQGKLEGMLSARRVGELREAYRTAARGRLFDAARRRLQASMPKVMPTKVRPKIQAVRGKLRAGPPSKADIARIHLAVDKRTRKIMMAVLHETADTLADEAGKDDRLIAWLLAKKLRAKLPGEKIAAFDAAIKGAGIADAEPQYIARAEGAIDAAIKGYDPDLTGILDPKTGKVTVTDEELGVPLKDKALEERVAKMLREALQGLDLPKERLDAIEPMLAGDKIEAERGSYFTAVRARLFDAARKKQAVLLPQQMPTKVMAKVMAIRTRVKAGGPPAESERARIERAVMKRTRKLLMQRLHAIADAMAVKAVKDEALVAASLAASIRKTLPEDKAEAFAAALEKAGITGDESKHLTEAGERVGSAIEKYDPDLTDIVDPNTGKVIVKDTDL